MNEERYDQIHRYLLGEMPQQEREEFEAEVATDTSLAEAVALERQVLALVRHDGRRQMKERLWGRPRRRSLPRSVWMGAIMAAAAGIALLIWIQWGDSGTSGLADKYFAHTDHADLERLMRGDTSTSPLAASLERYEQGKYGEAIASLDRWQDSVTAAKAVFLKAECHYQLGQLDSAVAGYDRSIRLAAKGAEVVRLARLHRALAFLKRCNEGAAMLELKDLQQEEGDDMSKAMRQDVAELLEKLKD